jgi:hypothetical protein
MPASVFVSYSHQDLDLVQPVVSMLRGFVGLVFHDVTGIKPGSIWEAEIGKALASTELVVLFWCTHSARSAQVKHEYETALSGAKDILPILLDSTPLPTELRKFQWVDFQRLVGRRHESFTPRTPGATKIAVGDFSWEEIDFYNLGSVRAGDIVFPFTRIGACPIQDTCLPTEEWPKCEFAKADEWPEYEIALMIEKELRRRGFGD